MHEAGMTRTLSAQVKIESILFQYLLIKIDENQYNR